jgi:hypothetical protein
MLERQKLFEPLFLMLENQPLELAMILKTAADTYEGDCPQRRVFAIAAHRIRKAHDADGEWMLGQPQLPDLDKEYEAAITEGGAA